MSGAVSRSLVIRNDLRELERVGVWVSSWSRMRNLSPSVAERIDLCVAEAVTNVITHAYSDDTPHEIRLLLSCDGEVVSLDIEDDGRAFDPNELEPRRPARSLAEVEVGGLGVQIVKKLSDELRYRRCGDLNRLTLLFRSAT